MAGFLAIMRPAGYVLTGLRRYRTQAHPPVILAHGLPAEFFGIEELADPYPDYQSFNTWPATAPVLRYLRMFDHLAGSTSLANFATWPDPKARRFVICTRKELARARSQVARQQSEIVTKVAG